MNNKSTLIIKCQANQFAARLRHALGRGSSSAWPGFGLHPRGLPGEVLGQELDSSPLRAAPPAGWERAGGHLRGHPTKSVPSLAGTRSGTSSSQRRALEAGLRAEGRGQEALGTPQGRSEGPCGVFGALGRGPAV